MQLLRASNMQLLRASGVQVLRASNMQLLRASGVQVLRGQAGGHLPERRGVLPPRVCMCMYMCTCGWGLLPPSHCGHSAAEAVHVHVHVHVHLWVGMLRTWLRCEELWCE